jgi:hypothetical protein
MEEKERNGQNTLEINTVNKSKPIEIDRFFLCIKKIFLYL